MPSPWLVLQSATKQMPALRYALGIAGIISVLAIAKSFQVDPKYGVIGVVIMLVLMTALLLFARLAEAQPKIFIKPMIFMLWSFTLLVVATAGMIFSAYFLGWPPVFNHGVVAANGYVITAGDRKAWYIQGLLENLHASWNGVKEGVADDDAPRILKESLMYAQKLKDIPDGELGPGGRLTKNDYICYAYVMASDVESDDVQKLEHAKNARQACADARAYLASIRDSQGKNTSYKATYDFAAANHETEWVDYLYASTYCTTGTVSRMPSDVSQSLQLLHSLPSWYIRESKPEKDNIFKRCVQGGNT